MLLSRGFFCRLCHEACLPISEFKTHFPTVYHCRSPRLVYGFRVRGVSVKLVSGD